MIWPLELKEICVHNLWMRSGTCQCDYISWHKLYGPSCTSVVYIICFISVFSLATVAKANPGLTNAQVIWESEVSSVTCKSLLSHILCQRRHNRSIQLYWGREYMSCRNRISRDQTEWNRSSIPTTSVGHYSVTTICRCKTILKLC